MSSLTHLVIASSLYTALRDCYNGVIDRIPDFLISICRDLAKPRGGTCRDKKRRYLNYLLFNVVVAYWQNIAHKERPQIVDEIVCSLCYNVEEVCMSDILRNLYFTVKYKGEGLPSAWLVDIEGEPEKDKIPRSISEYLDEHFEKLPRGAVIQNTLLWACWIEQNLSGLTAVDNPILNPKSNYLSLNEHASIKNTGILYAKYFTYLPEAYRSSAYVAPWRRLQYFLEKYPSRSQSPSKNSSSEAYEQFLSSTLHDSLLSKANLDPAVPILNDDPYVKVFDDEGLSDEVKLPEQHNNSDYNFQVVVTTSDMDFNSRPSRAGDEDDLNYLIDCFGVETVNEHEAEFQRLMDSTPVDIEPATPPRSSEGMGLVPPPPRPRNRKLTDRSYQIQGILPIELFVQNQEGLL